MPLIHEYQQHDVHRVSGIHTPAEGLAAEDVADVLFFGEDSVPGTAAGVAAIRLQERYPRCVGRPR
jgi:hypothetical protein